MDSRVLERIKRLLLRGLPATWAGRIRAWRVRRLIRTFPARVTEHSYGGTRLKVYLADPLAEAWYDHDGTTPPEITALQEGRLRRGARVFDVGAHQGVVAAMLAHVVGPSGQVVAVEASPHNCRIAEKNRELNALTQIEVVQAAVADRPGTIVFKEGLCGQIDDGSRGGGRLSVVAVTLDGLAERFGPPDVVFLDIEGAEYLALLGAPRVLASGADFFVEVHAGYGLEDLGGSVAQVLACFPPHRFELLARADKDESFRPLREDDPLFRDHFFLIARNREAPRDP